MDITAIADTILKAEPVESAKLAAAQKIPLQKGKKVALNWYKKSGTHAQISLVEAQNGKHNWYAYLPHFQWEQPSSLSIAGMELLTNFEDFAEKRSDGLYQAYWDDLGGVWTIGAGTVKGVFQGLICSFAECMNLLAKDLERYAIAVDGMVARPLKSDKRDALISFSYNNGSGALMDSSLLKYINEGGTDPHKIRSLFCRWNKSGSPLEPIAGLSRRRCAEAALYNGTDYRHYFDWATCEQEVIAIYGSKDAAGL